jgi:pimeloyl-ACP methyl ester carboxylesterase
MSVYILIHGAWHGGWCWGKVAKLLERAGHVALAPDQADAERVAELMDAESAPVILVGHSMGGAIISQAAEYRPEKAAALVYVCAYLLRDGESLRDAARRDTASKAPAIIVRSPDRQTMTFASEGAKDVFYTDCRDEDVAWALSRAVPQAVAPWSVPVHLTEDRFGRVPRIYIECLRDQAISLALQREMYGAAGCRQVFSLDTGHSPFLSAPEDLADILIALATRQ